MFKLSNWTAKSKIQVNYSFSSNATFVNEYWSIYQGKAKSPTSPNQKVSVHIFDKKKFEQLLHNNGLLKQKQVVQEIYDFLKTSLTNLAKFKHPLFLNILEPYEETNSKFLIVSEFVINSLNSLNQSSGELEDLEILKGFLQLFKSLEFLNTSTKHLHLNLQPSSIFINELNDWKLGGLGFIAPIPDFEEVGEKLFIKNYDPRMPNFINLNLNYTAPELIFEKKIYKNTDYWALGALIYYVYNKEPFLNCSNSVNYYEEEYTQFEQSFNANPGYFLKKVPGDFHDLLKLLLVRSPLQRLNNLKSYISGSNLVSGNGMLQRLIYLDEEFKLISNLEKKAFLESQLLPILNDLSKNLRIKKILNLMLELFSQQYVELLPVVLNIIILIGVEDLSNLSLYDMILSKVYKNFSLIGSSEETVLIMLESLSLIKPKITAHEADFQKFLTKLITKSLDIQTPTVIQTKALEQTGLILNSLDFPTLKNQIFPKITTIFVKTTSLQVKIHTVVAFQEFVKHNEKGLDKFMIKENILPLLKNIKAKDSRIVLQILAFYELTVLTLKKFETDDALIISDILPNLWELSSSESLDINGYKEFARIINEISKTLQEKRIAILQHKPLNNDSPLPSTTITSTKLGISSLAINKKSLFASNNTTTTGSTTKESTSTVKPNTLNSIIKPNVKPLSFQPTKKFGATPNTINNNLMSTTNFKNVEYEDFDDFQSASSLHLDTPSLSTLSINQKQPTNQPSTSIDWSKESYKTQNIKLPPGFGDSLVPMATKPQNIANTAYNDWGDSGSLI